MKIPKSKFTTEAMLALIEKRRSDPCAQHSEELSAFAPLAVRYYWIVGVSYSRELVVRKEQACYVEIELRVSASASSAARQEFIARAAKLGWVHQPYRDKRIIGLIGAKGERLADGSRVPIVGEQKVAEFEVRQDMFGEHLAMRGRPEQSGYNRLVIAQAEQLARCYPERKFIVRPVRWMNGKWQICEGQKEFRYVV